MDDGPVRAQRGTKKTLPKAQQTEPNYSFPLPLLHGSSSSPSSPAAPSTSTGPAAAMLRLRSSARLLRKVSPPLARLYLVALLPASRFLGWIASIAAVRSVPAAGARRGPKSAAAAADDDAAALRRSLRRALDLTFFPELYAVRTAL